MNCPICKGTAEKILTILWCTQCGTIKIRRRSEEKGYFQEVRWPVNMNEEHKLKMRMIQGKNIKNRKNLARKMIQKLINNITRIKK